MLEEKKHLPIILKNPLILLCYRDNNDHSSTANVTVRDTYYRIILQYAQEHRVPVNFWAYAGEGRPRIPYANWTQGDDFIGDPPHEPQGWYSVYDTDQSTLEIIKYYATMNSTPSSKSLSALFFILFSYNCVFIFSWSERFRYSCNKI